MPDRSVEQMREIVRRGASVMLNTGRIAAVGTDVPSAAAVAISSGDASARELARREAQQAIDAAQATLRSIENAEEIDRKAAEAQDAIDEERPKPDKAEPPKSLAQPPATKGK